MILWISLLMAQLLRSKARGNLWLLWFSPSHMELICKSSQLPSNSIPKAAASHHLLWPPQPSPFLLLPLLQSPRRATWLFTLKSDQHQPLLKTLPGPPMTSSDEELIRQGPASVPCSLSPTLTSPQFLEYSNHRPASGPLYFLVPAPGMLLSHRSPGLTLSLWSGLRPNVTSSKRLSSTPI